MSVDVSSWTSALWENNIETFSRQLEDENIWNQIPSLNGKSSCDFTDGQFVRFRGMIQDTHNPEFYMQQYEVLNTVTGTTHVKSGKYKDIIICELNEKIKVASTRHGERQGYYCISVPALNSWASQPTKKTQDTSNVKTSEEDRGQKRGAEEMMTGPSNVESGECSTSQKFKNESGKDGNKNAEPTPVYDLNFPLPGMEGQACILKVYDLDKQLLLNEVVEAAGFISLDPALACLSDSEDGSSAEERRTLHPPPSLIPRIHVVATRHLDHCVPLLPKFDFKNVLEQVLQATARDALHDLKIVLTPILLGDQLATDYMICHLISRVFLRQDVTVLGKCSTNFYNVPLDINYVERFNEILQLLLPKTYLFLMSMENINTIRFVPKKNYSDEQLKSGLLQLSAGTHLILDETKLTIGRLGILGARNVSALQTLIAKQKVDYDFEFYLMDFQTDIPLLIFSEKKSMLPCDVVVPIESDVENREIIEQSFNGAHFFLKNEEIANRIRTFLCAARLAEYTIPGPMQLVVQNDFVNMRQRNPDFKADDLHSLLILARLVSLSRGQQALTQELWQTVCGMEETRRQRLNSA